MMAVIETLETAGFLFQQCFTNCTNYVALNERLSMNHKLERTWYEEVMIYLRYHPSRCLE